MFLGAGKDWYHKNMVFGPVASLEYAFVSRPNITENGAAATNLDIDGDFYSSLPLTLGTHIGASWKIENNQNLTAHLLLAWQYEMLSDDLTSKASFVDYQHGFASKTPRPERNSLLVQSSLKLNTSSNSRYQALIAADFGANISKCSSYAIGLTFGINF